jgi:hypothetical protein
MTALIENDGGNFVGTVNAQRYVENTLGHHFLSTPVYSPTLTQLNDDISLNLSSSPFPNIYYYDETNPSLNYMDGWTAPASLSHTMNEAEGYTLYFNASGGKTLDIEGAPINGSVSRGLSYTAGSNPPTNITSAQGWNFVGNPYPSPINYDILMTSQTAANSAAIDNGYYTWNPSTNSYNSYIAGISSPTGFNNVIHSMQGFWIRANANTTNSTTLDFDNSVRLNDPTATTYNFLKSVKPQILRLRLLGHTSDCETVVVLRDQASNNFDGDYDAYYLKSEQNNRVELSSVVNNELIRINSLCNDLSKNISVPLMNKVSVDSVYTLKMTHFENFPSHVEVYIEDKELDIWVSLSDDSYVYNGSPADRDDRFVLHLIVDGSTINTEKIEQEENTVSVYKCEESLCLEFTKQTEEDLNLIIYDKTGKLIYRKNLDIGLSKYSLSDIYLSNNDIYIVYLPERGIYQKIKW